ncbi:MAG TPA: alpha/beta hydrolase [Chroococcales cyanobacterium]
MKSLTFTRFFGSVVTQALLFLPLSASAQSGQATDFSGLSGGSGGGGGGLGGGRFASGSTGARSFSSLSDDQKQRLLERFRQKRGRRSALSAAEQPGNAADVAVRRDIAYGKAPLEKLDIYTAKDMTGKPAMPILIFAHGGGWYRGDKMLGDHENKSCSYVGEGVIFVSVDYRLAPDVVHPKEVEDIAAAIAWVKNHAREFNGDPDRIFLMGHSAGAHLVDLVATNDKYLQATGLSLADIKGVISLDTASLDLTDRLKEGSFESKLVGPMIVRAFGTNPAVLKDASPTLNLEKGKNYPPFLMFCGSQRVSCVEQHAKFARRLQALGGQVTVRSVPLSHGDINRASGLPSNEIYKECLQMIKS